ncbi:hypothetical protein DAERI_090117 [Deinococcus aerius]|uniref:Uncharacterized protein n=1 Tax=Deinococcus aerius TaxID=200253 RepID=A0A2I9DN95_9DEIO|nr:hypothetical protein DAERI_090117 [Deinococcus aerius]
MRDGEALLVVLLCQLLRGGQGLRGSFGKTFGIQEGYLRGTNALGTPIVQLECGYVKLLEWQEECSQTGSAA